MSVLTTLEQQVNQSPLASASHIVVAYSGGVDSHVLLHALHHLKQQQQYQWQLSAIHIHHGLSANADAWQAHCELVCQRLNVPLQTARLQLDLTTRQSLEAVAREQRYQKLAELAPADCLIVLGQHQDDQLETFLLQLKRGAGPKGLASMSRSWQEKSAKQVAFTRPLLDVSQAQILAYAQSKQLAWCEDESNQNTDFERNFLRQQVLPTLLERWPELAATVSRSAKLCAEQQALLDESCDEKLQQMGATAQTLPCQALLQLSDTWLKQVVRYWLSQQNIASPSQAVLEKLKSEVLNAKGDAKPILQWQDWQFRRFQQSLYVIPVPAKSEDFIVNWQGQPTVSLPHNAGQLEFSSVDDADSPTENGVQLTPSLGPVIIRQGGFSVKFKPYAKQPSKPVKQWFKEWQIPPWQREKAILLLQNEQLLALWVENKCWPCAQSIQGQAELTVRLVKPS